MRKLLEVPALGLPARQGGAAQPRDAQVPVFEAAWQAHAFAIVMALYGKGHYSWAEWDDYLGYEIQSPGHFTWSGADEAEPGEAFATRVGAAAAPATGANYNRWIAACEEDGANFYELWLTATENLLVAKGIVEETELAERVALLAKTEGSGPRFTAGGKVSVRDISRVGHTHLPRYLRGKTGTVENDRGLFVFPEADDHGGAETLQHVYTVGFEAREIWGAKAEKGHSVYFNLWDYNLDPA
ncbi:MAG: nitrile hydratase subunit beta [Alphaproteobacteria bacterium]|jgi:nitrile hydratase|nr:nitrile hydratase subunit beta [Alphaproteobacteria bacterium]